MLNFREIENLILDKKHIFLSREGALAAGKEESRYAGKECLFWFTKRGLHAMIQIIVLCGDSRKGGGGGEGEKE